LKIAEIPERYRQFVFVVNAGGPSRKIIGRAIIQKKWQLVTLDCSHRILLVALKVLKPDFAKDEKARKRFIRGIKTVCTLNHSNLVVLHSIGITDGRCSMAMEYIEGESLSQVMKAGRLEWPRARKMAVHIAKCLGYLHDRGVNPEKPRKLQTAIPDSFEAIVMKVLAKRPQDRFQIAVELLTVFRQSATDQKVREREYGTTDHTDNLTPLFSAQHTSSVALVTVVSPNFVFSAAAVSS
jgi:hypothetical protein